ncbi:Cmc1p KNAG_0A06170 [Huiozyma naganishii CBS 8797]|uniref:COX assembly mitochondrial protein n=1 Tax=Huiozyma naganishii (strain ATCC MYA-139 / BCRC 22969 / CBS 8797 / KCTC 17520 / NBRC 10181 / NCYC 3082 / Yp74L-3) TaxID=1071383 RepID=J7S2N7_HUIN7|nr:hypothetical protein KNAG_0A06170 [Kazachstania naganishii CBS 8797]CCK68279.1 hypothetical protein KNAG_0A06170 [Kazachstania naganishii CBS 8797]
MSTETQGSTQGKDGVAHHNVKIPIWVLSPQEEKKARKNLKTFTYEKCGEYVQAMANCAKQHGVKVFPSCSAERDKMKECLMFYQLDEKYLDEQRNLIVVKKIEKLEERLKQQKAQLK